MYNDKLIVDQTSTSKKTFLFDDMKNKSKHLMNENR